jgi:hypothetical protein
LLILELKPQVALIAIVALTGTTIVLINHYCQHGNHRVTRENRSALLRQPLVTNQLCVNVGDFIRSVMDASLFNVRLRSLHEEDVAAGAFLAKVEVHEHQHIYI